MTNTEARFLVQGGQCDSVLQREAWQHLYSNRAIDKMQPYYGKRAEQLVEEGVLVRRKGRHQ